MRQIPFLVLAGLFAGLPLLAAQEKKPPPEAVPSYARVELKGTLLQVDRKKKIWAIKVQTALTGEITWGLDLLNSKELEQAAERLQSRTVLLTGEIVCPPASLAPGSVVLPPAPFIWVRTLRPAEEKPPEPKP